MRAKFFVSTGVVVGVVTVFAFAAYRANERKLASLEKEIRSLSEQNRKSAAHETVRHVYVMATASGAPARATPPTPETAAPDVEPSSEPPENEDIIAQERSAHVDMMFSQEATDRAWAAPAERALGGSLRTLTETSTLDSLECHQTLCKGSLHHQDQAKFSAFIDRVVNRANELWTGEFVSYRESVGLDGIIQSSIYFAKPGGSIPQLE